MSFRPRALDRLRADAGGAASSARSARAVAERRRGYAAPPPSPYQVLIEELLHDNVVDDAWALAVEHGCNQALWMALAKACEKEHPLDAVGVYQREVEQLVDRKQTRSYEAAVELIAHIVELLHAAGHDAGAYVAEVRHRHKPKTKFLGFLDVAGM